MACPGRHQAIIWTDGGMLLIRLTRTNFNEILIEYFHSWKSISKFSGKWRPFCLGLNVLPFKCWHRNRSSQLWLQIHTRFLRVLTDIIYNISKTYSPVNNNAPIDAYKVLLLVCCHFQCLWRFFTKVKQNYGFCNERLNSWCQQASIFVVSWSGMPHGCHLCQSSLVIPRSLILVVIVVPASLCCVDRVISRVYRIIK